MRAQVVAGHPISAFKTLVWILREQRAEVRLGINTFLSLDPEAREDENHLYEALSYHLLDLLLNAVSPADSAREQVFLDAGCGLGRAVCVAATRPYRRVVGFDFDGDYVEGARKNLAALGRRRRCGDVDVQQADAVRYVVPDDVNVVFFFNSFRGAVRRAFMAAIDRSLVRRPRVVSLLLCNVSDLDSPEFGGWTVQHRWMSHYPTCTADSKFSLPATLLRRGPDGS